MRNFRLDDESGHQEALFSWAAYRTGLMPEGLEIRVRLRTYDGYRKHELVQLCRTSGKER